jgi:formylglycine-generating enzyme required for sulfatase activity
MRGTDVKAPISSIAAALLVGLVLLGGLRLAAGGGMPAGEQTKPEAPPTPANASKEPETPEGMVRIPGGTFMMGCSPGDSECADSEKPQHQVTVRSFLMDRTPVTQEQFNKKAPDNPSRFSDCPRCPVESISWSDASTFCDWVGKRLPTEAEWEYAARAGTTGPRYGDLNAIAWYGGNSGLRTHPVAQKLPNAYGLYDMLGNVWEWCADENPGKMRSMRGGAFERRPAGVRVSLGFRVHPLSRVAVVGFRCVRDEPPQ